MSSRRSTVEAVLTRAWMRRGPLALLLWPVSMLFHGLSVLRRTLYSTGVLRSTRLPVPVVVVGNIFVGGTGKTPMTIWLVEAMRRAGFQPGVISRGYGTNSDVVRAVTEDSIAQEVGDEPLLIARRARCPIMVGQNRVAAAQALLASHPEVNLIISDDGLQHYALQRNVEIVLSDARGNGNGWLLPAGPLREPASRPRDFTVVNSQQPLEGIFRNTFQMQLAGDVAERMASRSDHVLLKDIARSQSNGQSRKRIVAAAGIGNPARFFTTLRAAGLVFDEMPLPDHYSFVDNPFAETEADIILITEKDAVKCSQNAVLRNDPRLWVVPVTARIADTLAEQIVEKCLGRPIA